MASGSGTDAVAKINNDTADISSTLDKEATGAPTNVLQRAIVVELLNDLSAYSTEEYTELQTMISSPKLLESAPRNSLICRLTTAGSDKRASDAKKVEDPEEDTDPEPTEEAEAEEEDVGVVGVLCYPFFPPHLCFPIKPGEQVWVIADSPDVQQNVMYWMCRIPAPDHVDDLNYTHGDRAFVGGNTEETTSEKALSATSEEEPGATSEETQEAQVFGFPNGPGTPDASTLKGEPPEAAYEDIVNTSLAYVSFTPEPVPRFTKRPGDLAFQGSNNTLICLGEDRGWSHPDSSAERVLPDLPNESSATRTESEISLAEEGGWGAIDLVAGRGRYDFRFLGGDVLDEPELTACRTVETEPIDSDEVTGRDPYPEANKNPLGNQTNEKEVNRLENPTEGDPDFEHDASRVYVAMKTLVDTNFHIDEQGATAATVLNTSTEAGGVTADSAYFDAQVSMTQGAVVLKSDEIRILARRSDSDVDSSLPDGAPDINGSIRLIKEGVAGEDLAALYLMPDGTVQVTGSKILIANPDSADARLDAGQGDSGTEPYLRYSDFVVWADALVAAIIDSDAKLATGVQNNATAMQNGFNIGSSGGWQWVLGPNSAMGGAWTVMNAMASIQTSWENIVSVKTDAIQSAHDSNYPAIASERIFGE